MEGVPSATTAHSHGELDAAAGSPCLCVQCSAASVEPGAPPPSSGHLDSLEDAVRRTVADLFGVPGGPCLTAWVIGDDGVGCVLDVVERAMRCERGGGRTCTGAVTKEFLFGKDGVVYHGWPKPRWHLWTGRAGCPDVVVARDVVIDDLSSFDLSGVLCEKIRRSRGVHVLLVSETQVQLDSGMDDDLNYMRVVRDLSRVVCVYGTTVGVHDRAHGELWPAGFVPDELPYRPGSGSAEAASDSIDATVVG